MQEILLFLHVVFFYVTLDEIVALKRLKMEKEKEGFPITSLREINTLLKSQHMNIVTVRVSLRNDDQKLPSNPVTENERK